MMYKLIIVFIILTLFFIYLYSIKTTEKFSDYKIDNIGMYNVFGNQRLLDGQTSFPIHTKKNIIYKTDFYNANIEISNDSMQNILNLFISKKNINTKFEDKKKYKYKYYDNVEIPYVNTEVYKDMKQKIKDNINYTLKNNDFEANKDRFFMIINDTIIDYKENNDYIKITFLLNIYREVKYSGFQIYCTCYFDKKIKEIFIKKSYIYSTLSSEDVYILPGYDKKSENNLNVYSSCFPYTSYGGEKTYIRNSQQTRILPSKKQSKNILKDRKATKILNFYNKSYQCYGSTGEDYYNCISNLDIMNRHKKEGIWDRPCYSNKECPFYKANKNYTNNRGGCINGFCEMPLNIKSLTYRHYNKLTKPFCYNCKNNTNLCCETQMKENPRLLSPDYTFVGDKIERYNNRKQLEEKGLKWYTINKGII